MRVAQVNYAFDARLRDPAALLDRYTTLTAWSDAIAGAAPDMEVVTLQQFHSPADVTRGAVRYVFGDFLTIARAAARFEPHLVHVNGLGFPLRTWLLRRPLPAATALVVQDHASGDPGDAAAAKNAVRRSLMRPIDAFLFSAPEQADAWRRARLIAPARSVHAVMEASTTIAPLSREEARSGSGVTGAPAILWVGRLNANKDPLTVLDGLGNASTALTSATLTMVYGDNELLSAVKSRVQSSPILKDRVRLVGAVPHDRMAAFYSAADLFVAGSHHEGSGYAVIEAMACGAIPVVTDIPSFQVLTGGGSVGTLWTPGNASACARALVEVASRDRSAERQRVLDHFQRELTWDAIGRRAVAVYRDVVDRCRNRPAGRSRRTNHVNDR
jgi:glycosyltransferase involved in cell wall biosynthesis